MSPKIRSIKNCTVDYLDEMATERQEAVVRFAIKHGRKTRTMKRWQPSAINDELAMVYALLDTQRDPGVRTSPHTKRYHICEPRHQSGAPTCVAQCLSSPASMHSFEWIKMTDQSFMKSLSLDAVCRLSSYHSFV